MKKFMKNTIGIIALAVVIGLSFVSCSDGGGTSGDTMPQSSTHVWVDSDGYDYKLVLTESRAVNGTYTLSINETVVSTGTYSGTLDNLTLTPNTGTVINIQISENNATVNGTINGKGLKGGYYYLDDGVQKIIKITGYNSKLPNSNTSITYLHGVGVYTESSLEITTTVATSGGSTIEGNIVTFEPQRFKLNGIPNPHNQGPWTATGKFFITVEFQPPTNDTSKTGSHYVYSEGGVNPARVDIKNQITTLEWSKFIWFEDYIGG